jgi:sugar/nucleoside kinase (ribokinase family)
LTTHVVSNVAPGDTVISRYLGDAGLRLHLGTSARTTRFVNRLDQDRRDQQMPATADTIAPDLLNTVVPRADWIHLGPLHPLDIDPNLLAILAGWRKTVLLDVQGYTRKLVPDTYHIQVEMSDLIPAALKAASMVKAGHEELDLILRSMNTGPSDLMDRFNIDELVVTTGARGGCIWSRRAPPVEYDSPPVSRPINPTGAGDVFFAAFAVNRLLLHRSILSAAREAADLAARQVAGTFIDTAIEPSFRDQNMNT